MGLLPRSATAPALIAAACLLGYINWRVSALSIDQTPIIAKGAAQGVAAKPSDTSSPDEPVHQAMDYPNTAQRPLFFANRRIPEKPKPKPQPQAAAAEVQAPLPSLEPLTLIGIRGDGRDWQVLVRTAGNTQGTWLSVGDQFRGWSVREVSTDNAIVEGRGQRAELKLYSTAQQPQSR